MKKKTCIDCYGNRLDLSPLRYLSRLGFKSPYLVDASNDGVTYLGFFQTDPQPIHRITENAGVTEILWAYGDWDDRANLTYETETSKPIVIEV